MRCACRESANAGAALRTLSVSTCMSNSSASTRSPTAFPISTIVPSVIESPIAGTGKRWRAPEAAAKRRTPATHAACGTVIALIRRLRASMMEKAMRLCRDTEVGKSRPPAADVRGRALPFWHYYFGRSFGHIHSSF